MHDLAASTGTPLRGPELETFLLEECGFVRVAIIGRRHASIRLDSRRAHHVAVTAALMFVCEQGAKGGSLIDRAAPSRPVLLPTHAALTEYLNGLVIARASTTRYLRRTIDKATSVFSGRLSAVHRLLLDNETQLSVKLGVMERVFNGRFTLNERDGETGELRILASGQALQKIDDFFDNAAEGATYYEMTDRRYGSWVASSLKATSESEPQTEAVDAMLTTLAGVQRMTYERLLLPARCGDERLLWVATQVV